MTEPRNRVVQVTRYGDPDGLDVLDAALPTPGPGEVRVRVLASSIEYTDVVIRRHVYPQTMRRRPPFVMGYDVVGEIDQVGEGVSGFQIGDRVADMTVVGSNAAYRTLRAVDLTRVPPEVDAVEASVARVYVWRRLLSWLPRGKRIRVYSINLMRARHPTWFKEDLERLFALLATRAIAPRIAGRISFEEVAEAHRRLEAGGLEGRLVLCPDLPPQHDRIPPLHASQPTPVPPALAT